MSLLIWKVLKKVLIFLKIRKNGTVRKDKALLRKHVEREPLFLSFSDRYHNCDYNYIMISTQFRSLF